MVCVFRRDNDKGDIIEEGDDENELNELKKKLNIYDPSINNFKVKL